MSGDSVTRRQERAARRRERPQLSTEAIVDAALRIVDAEGTAGVSMRRVADEFDTGPASLYAHVANKEELLRLAYQRATLDPQLPGTGPWQDVLRALAHGTRDVLRRHQDLAFLGFGTIPVGPPVYDLIERVLAAMISGGVPPQVAAWALDTLVLFTTADVYEGWLLARRFADGSGRDPDEVGEEYFRDALAPMAELPPERYPYITAHLKELTTGGDDERFGFGVEMLIAGVAAQIPGHER